MLVCWLFIKQSTFEAKFLFTLFRATIHYAFVPGVSSLPDEIKYWKSVSGSTAQQYSDAFYPLQLIIDTLEVVSFFCWNIHLLKLKFSESLDRRVVESGRCIRRHLRPTMEFTTALPRRQDEGTSHLYGFVILFLFVWTQKFQLLTFPIKSVRWSRKMRFGRIRKLKDNWEQVRHLKKIIL